MHNCEKCSIFCLHCQRLFSADFRTSTVLKCRPVKWAERGIDFCSFISDRLKPHLSSAISNSLSKATLLETQWASFLVYLHLSKKNNGCMLWNLSPEILIFVIELYGKWKSWIYFVYFFWTNFKDFNITK